MSNPLISVGIAFYNNEKTLLDAIKSVFSQTFQDWELILVDDGGTDGSLDIARSIDDPRVRVLPPDGENRRLAVRLNQIAQAARGEFIARMDADDMSHPQRLARQLEFFDTHKEVDLLGTSMYIINERLEPACKIMVPETHEVISRNRFENIPMAHATVMARTKWFRRWPYDEKCLLSQDQELWMRSISESTFANIAEPLYLCNEFTAASLPKYVKATYVRVRNIMKYGPAEIGYLRCVYYAGIRCLKVAVYSASIMLGMRDSLLRKRYSHLTPEEYAEAIDAVDVIRRTKLPIHSIK